jgi:hypothetical protein
LKFTVKHTFVVGVGVGVGQGPSDQNKLSKSGQFEKQGDLPAKIQVPPNVAAKHHLVPS